MSTARKLVSVHATTLVVPRSSIVPTPQAAGSRAIEPSVPSLEPLPSGGGLSTRLGAFAALCGVAACLAYAGYSLYTCARDAFVVPTILSPSSEDVVATKLRLGQLKVERVRAVAELESVEAELAGSEQAIDRLRALGKTTGEALTYTSRDTSRRATESSAELAALEQQRVLLDEMLAKQTELTRRAKAELEAGLISRSEYSQHEQALNQMQLALLDNSRAVVRGRSALEETSLVREALLRESGPKSPDVVQRQEQMIRVELEMLRLDAERRAKSAQRDALSDRIAQLDEMVQHIEETALFQAIEKDLELAFVPYTQLASVTPGADVYSCLWGVVWCERVGTVTSLMPGEVVQSDPWGSTTRGEYAVLELADRSSARAKTLRIRSWARAPRAAAAQTASQ